MPTRSNSWVALRIVAVLTVGMTMACHSRADSDHAAAAGHTPMNTLYSAPAPVHLADATVRVTLTGSTADARKSLAAGHHMELVLAGLSSDKQPGITYRVYLGLAPDASPDDAHFVQTINFFNSVALDGKAARRDVELHFDVTALAGKVLQGGGDICVTIVPIGHTENGAHPQIGSIALIAK